MITPVQSKIASWVTQKLNKDYNVDIQIDRVSISLFGRISLEEIFIRDNHKDTLIFAKKINTSILNIKELVKSNLYFDDIRLQEVFFNMKTYKGDSISNFDIFAESFNGESPSEPSQEPFLMKTSYILLENSRLKITDENDSIPTLVEVDKLNTQIADFFVNNSDVNFRIISSRAIIDKELNIRNLQSNFEYTDSAIKLDTLLLITPYSHLQGQVHFLSNQGSFADFKSKVKLQAEFRESQIGTEDINIFYKGFLPDKILRLEGRLKGTLQNIDLQSFKSSIDRNYLRGNISFRNIFNKNLFEFKARNFNFSGNYNQLMQILPADLSQKIKENINNLDLFNISGNFYYSPENLDLNLNFKSNSVGNFSANGYLNNLKNINKSTYDFHLITEKFNLGKLLNKKELGLVSSEVKLSGKSLNINQIEKSIGHIKIKEFDYNNYKYNHIEIHSNINKNNIKTNIFVNDKNLKLTTQANANLNSVHQYNLKANIQEAKLHSIGLIHNDSIAIFKGNLTFEAQGNSLNEMSGKMNFQDVSYLKNNQTFAFEKSEIQVGFNTDNERVILFNSTDAITGKITGKFRFEETSKIFQNSIGSIYTNYKPFKVSNGQYLHFNLKIHSKIVEVFVPEIRLTEQTFLKGNIISDSNDFKLDFQSPKIKIYNSELKNVNFSVDNKNPFFNTLFEISNINSSTYKISDFSLINTPIKDTLLFRTEFKGGEKQEDKFMLKFYHTINKKQASVFGFKTSEIFFKGKEWIINKENQQNRVIIDKRLDSISIENFKIQHKEQFLVVKGKTAKENFKDIHLIFNKLELQDIIPDIPEIQLKGVIDGHLSLLQRKEKYFPESNILIEKFSLNNYPVGDIEIGIQGNEDLSSFKINTQIANEKQESLRLSGDLFFKRKKTYLDVYANIQRFNLKPFNSFVDGIFSNLRGNITGDIHINDLLINPKFNGLLYFENAGLGIPYLNIDTDLSEDASILLKDNELFFNNITLTDVIYKTQASLNGKIHHKKFENWFLDVHIDTKNKRFLALNTQAKDNDLFYGTGFINGKASIKGEVNDLTISVNASTSEGTKFKIPLNETKTIGDDSFIHFINRKNKNKAEEKQVQTIQGIEMDFELNILPNAEIEVIIDPKSGSNLIGKGVGTLLLEINTNGKFNMWGDFITTSGEYNFKYENIIDKKFKVLPGGSILWNGNPLNAELENLKAVYSLLANPSVLLESNQYNRKIQTQVEISIEGNLTHPQTIFNILFPDSSPALVSELNYRLKDLDKKQLQAFSLLLQGGFLSDTSAGQKVLSYNMIETATGIFNQFLSDENEKLNLGISYEKNTVDPNQNFYQNNDRIGITLSANITDRILLNGKIAIPVGGTTQTAIAGDIEIQFLLTKDGNLSAKIFNKENEVQQYLLDTIGYTQGVGISYKVDFDTFKELINGIVKIGNKK